MPSVSDTNIFARRRGDRQLLVYEMRLETRSPVAMILPLPVAPGGDDALRFIDLTDHADLFGELAGAFVGDITGLGDADAASPAPLRVHRVGAFEASYIPSHADFARLDPRFRVDDRLWRRLPGYRDAGFAVFQLRPGAGHVHPMAFEFPARQPERLFFPTLHIHGGELPAQARFDHSLFFQGFDDVDHHGIRGGASVNGVVSERSVDPLRHHVRGPRAAELFDLDAPVFRLRVDGRQRNDDTWLVPDPADPRIAVTGEGASAWTAPA